MGRSRSFDTGAVVQLARDAFVRSGYHGTSVDDLLRATGIQRASLYGAFASKRGLFLAALDVLEGGSEDAEDLDLLLVALMDLAADDAAVRDRTTRALERLGESAPELLGRRLIDRGRTADDARQKERT